MTQTDRDLSTQVQAVFRKHEISHYFGLNDDIKAALVERFNRTLKSRHYCYMSCSRTRR
jgi:hypothetical protein